MRQINRLTIPAAILKGGICAGVIRFFGVQQFGRDGEGGEGLEKGGPGGKDRIG
jgi:hypothetical protein